MAERNLSLANLSHYFFPPVQILIDVFLCQICFLLIPSAEFEVRVFLTGAYVSCLAFYGLYGFKNWTIWEETSSALKAWLLTLLIDVLFLFSVKFRLSALRVFAAVSVFVPLTLAARYFFRVTLFKMGLLVKSVIILGAGEAGKIFAKKILSSPFAIRKAVCFLDDDESKQGCEISGVKVSGTLSDFADVQGVIKADEAVIAIPTAPREKLADILKSVEQHIGTVLYVPDMYMLTVSSASMGNLDGMPVISSSQGLLNPVNRFVKSVIDYAGGFVALVIFSPVMIWAAYRIKKEDGGPVFFTQTRIGTNLKPFRMCKFRTMIPNADKILAKILQEDENLRAEFERDFKLKDDPRITSIGNFLRNSSLDELPQILNILKGDMSLVGPRPIEPKEVNDYYTETEAKTMFSAKPGITGMWQVSGRSDLDVITRKGMNLYYVHNWSIWLDITILMKTPLAVVTHKGAY